MDVIGIPLVRARKERLPLEVQWSLAWTYDGPPGPEDTEAHPERSLPMFDHHCPACGKRQLLFPSQITGIVNDEQGIVVLLTCWCGEPAAVRTGRASRPAGQDHVLAS
jgi:hypothetical protein